MNFTILVGTVDSKISQQTTRHLKNVSLSVSDTCTALRLGSAGEGLYPKITRFFGPDTCPGEQCLGEHSLRATWYF